MLGPGPDGYQAHHVIPQELYDSSEFKGILGVAGNADTKENGVWLPGSKKAYKDNDDKDFPGKTIHRGGHKGYTNDVAKRLRAIKNNKNLSTCEKKAQVAALQADLKDDLLKGTHSFKNSDGDTVKGLNKNGVATKK